MQNIPTIQRMINTQKCHGELNNPALVEFESAILIPDPISEILLVVVFSDLDPLKSGDVSTSSSDDGSSLGSNGAFTLLPVLF